MTQGEIILYKSDSATFEIEVRIEDDTVWLIQNHMEMNAISSLNVFYE